MLSVMFYYCCSFVFFFKQKTAYEMRISDWSSDVCSSDLKAERSGIEHGVERNRDKSAKIEEKRRHGSASESGLLNGPQLPGAAKTQMEVDALFGKLD